MSLPIIKSSSHSTRRRSPLSAAMSYTVLGAAAVFGFFPIYWMVLTSVSPDDQVFEFPPRFFVRAFTTEHYAAFFEDPQLLGFLLNSLLVASLTAAGTLIVAFFAAYSLSKFRYPGRHSLMYLVLSAQMIPASLLLIALYGMFNVLDLLDTYLALVLSFTTFTLPLCVWLLKNYLDNIPTELIEAAKADGARQNVIMFRVLLPVARPGLIAAGLFAFIRGWNDFIFALTLVDTGKQTLPPGLALTFMGQYGSAWADMMAASLIASLPVVAGFIFAQKHLVSGLTAGSLKG